MKYSASRATSRNCGPLASTGTSSKPDGVISIATSNTGFGNLGENMIFVAISGTGLRSDDADERDALARRAAEAIGEGELAAAAHAGDLALALLPAQLTPGPERQRHPVRGVVGVAMPVLGPHDDGRGRAVADAGAIEDAEGAGHDGRAGDRLLRHFLAELRTRVERAVLVILPRDARDHVLELGLVDAELPGVGGRQQAEGGRRGERR